MTLSKSVRRSFIYFSFTHRTDIHILHKLFSFSLVFLIIPLVINAHVPQLEKPAQQNMFKKSFLKHERRFYKIGHVLQSLTVFSLIIGHQPINLE